MEKLFDERCEIEKYRFNLTNRGEGEGGGINLECEGEVGNPMYPRTWRGWLEFFHIFLYHHL